MAAAAISHFHCPACGPLIFGRTRAVCGAVIPPQIVGRGPERKCPGCKAGRRAHEKQHR